jgi:protease I
MSEELNEKRVAFLVANEGIEQVELVEPRKAIEGAGAATDLIAPEAGEAQAVNHSEKADRFEVDLTLADADPSDYDGLVMPGGVANPDKLRMDPDAVEFVRAFIDAGKPVAAICHAPWMLVEANVVSGRRLTSYPSLRTDVLNAGGEWVDEEVVTDNGLVTSRRPDDVPAFCAKAIEEIAEGVHEQQRVKTA